MSTCAVCKDAILEEDTAKCGSCGLCFHPKCTKGGERKFLRMKGKHAFRCELCKDESSASVSDGEDRSSILAAINRLDAKVDSRLSDIQSTIADMRTDFSQLNLTVKSLQVDNASLKEELCKLGQVNSALRGEVDVCRSTISRLEQYSRINNVVVYGIPVTKGEDVYEVLRAVASAIGAKYVDDSVSISHRLRGRQNQHPAIVVSFSSRRVKDIWLSASKAKGRLMASDIHPSFGGTPVTIREHLSAGNMELLRRARAEVNAGRLAYAWYVSGKVLVRKQAGGPAVCITSQEDIMKFI